ncbi:MAG: SDR family oxidoreductase [Acidimicrobiia bacterium]|nr:SDR family oxidoreductase [Acidimicrobiia bacterium]
MERPVAVVTGASAGIGAEFARALAARGSDLVVVARNEQRLDELATTLRDEHGATVEVLPADLETSDGVAKVEARLAASAGPVELLVNNAGFGTNGSFHTLPVDGEVAEINLNVVALVRLTHAALGPMVGRGHGGVINVSSVGAYQPTPYSATYAATKAFVSSFTNAIHEELDGTGVKAMVLAPGFTHTEFHVRAKIENNDSMPGFVWQTPEEVVTSALKAYDKGRAVCIPGALNNVAAAFSGSMPAGVTRKIAGMVTKRAY